MKLLALETSTDACSCALWIDGTLQERFEIAPRQHGTLVLSMIEALLAEAGLRLHQLDGLAFGCGPGTFTGLRMAAGVAQGLAFSAGLPVVPVSSLAALAQGASLLSNGSATERIWVIQDARMGEVYHSAFLRAPNALVNESTVPRLCRPEQITPPPGDGRWIIVGSAWSVHHLALAQALVGCDTEVLPDLRYPHAADVARLGVDALQSGRTVSADQALPIYLRDEVANRPATNQTPF